MDSLRNNPDSKKEKRRVRFLLNETQVEFREPYLPDWLPKTYDRRIFIGGNYDHPVELRRLREATDQVCRDAGLDFVTIFPLDSCNLPKEEIHDWDMRILHNCKYAIFEVSNPGGELMEIERAGAEYKTKTLLLFQARGPEDADVPRHAKTMLLQSGPHTVLGYTDESHSKEIIKDFLMAPDVELFEDYINVLGFSVQRIEKSANIEQHGLATIKLEHKGVKAHQPNLQEIPHEMYSSHSRVLDIEVSPRERVEWILDPRSTEQIKPGWVRFLPDGLEETADPLDYTITYVLDSQTVVFTREEIETRYANDILPYESIGHRVDVPAEWLSMSVNFFDRFDGDPGLACFYGATRLSHSETLRDPSDKFHYDSQKKLARLLVRRPRLFSRYEIYWTGEPFR